MATHLVKPSPPRELLYVAYWGLLEPLGQALVLPAIRSFAERKLRVTLISFEKAHDLDQPQKLGALNEELRQRGVLWLPLPYHKGATTIAKARDILAGVTAALRQAPSPDIIHGRTFVGGLMASVISALERVPFVFHNEGFWPDQQVEAGVWPAGGRRYRLFKALERMLYRRADGVFALSERSRPAIASLRVGREATVAIVPSATDLGRFLVTPRERPSETPRLIYIGNLGGRYPVLPLVRFCRALLKRQPSASRRVLALSGVETLRAAWNEHALPQDRLCDSTVAPEAVPAYLSAADAGLSFLGGGIGDQSGSPTKVGEYWASGLALVCSPGIGDPEDVVRTERVGVVVDDMTDQGLDVSAIALLQLLDDPGLRARCRAAAEKYYALDQAVNTQIDLYEKILDARA